jgi:hypothetical protein
MARFEDWLAKSADLEARKITAFAAAAAADGAVVVTDAVDVRVESSRMLGAVGMMETDSRLVGQKTAAYFHLKMESRALADKVAHVALHSPLQSSARIPNDTLAGLNLPSRLTSGSKPNLADRNAVQVGPDN